MLNLKDIPFARRAAGYAAEAAAGASTRFAAARSQTAAGFVRNVGKGAELVGSAAGSSLVVLDKGVERVSRPMAKAGALIFGIPTALAAGAAYALDGVSGPLALALVAFCTSGGCLIGYLAPRVVAMMTVGQRVQTVQIVADSVAKVCKPAAGGAPAPGEKERPAA